MSTPQPQSPLPYARSMQISIKGYDVKAIAFKQIAVNCGCMLIRIPNTKKYTLYYNNSNDLANLGTKLGKLAISNP